MTKIIKKFLKDRFISNTVMQYFMTFTQIVFPLITFPYLTRVLKPEMYGVVTFLTATISYFQIFIDFGFNLSVTKKIAERQNDYIYIGNILSNTLFAKLFLFIVSIVVYSILIPFIDIMRENILLCYLYILNVFVMIFLPDYLFRGIEQMQIITVRYVISKTISIMLIFTLVKNDKDVIYIPIIDIVGSLFAVILTWSQIKKLNIAVKFLNLRNSLIEIKDAAIYFLSTFASIVFGATNTFILGIVAKTSIDIAFWGMSYKLISSAQSLYSPIVNSLYPRIAANKNFKIVKKVLIILMPLIIITSLLVYKFSDIVILIFAGEDYIEATPIFRALIPVLIFSFPAMVLGFPVLGNIGKAKETTFSTIISALFHIVGLFILALTRKFSILSVAILRSITELVLLLSRLFILFYNKNICLVKGKN